MSSKQSGQRRVLVVNDKQEILELFVDILSPLDFDVVTMSYAPRELERIREVEPDLIVLDFIFGERELLGWQLLQKLKMDRSLADLPVIICTAALEAVRPIEGYLAEQNVQVVIKPFTVVQLEDAVRSAMATPATAREVQLERHGDGKSDA